MKNILTSGDFPRHFLLLQGADWQANRIKVYRSLGHLTNPQDAIKSLGLQLDSHIRVMNAEQRAGILGCACGA